MRGRMMHGCFNAGSPAFFAYIGGGASSSMAITGIFHFLTANRANAPMFRVIMLPHGGGIGMQYDGDFSRISAADAASGIGAVGEMRGRLRDELTTVQALLPVLRAVVFPYTVTMV